MSANGEVIKEFLVSLGFMVDDSSLKKFGKAIDNAYVRIGLIATGIQAATAGIVYGISKITEGFEQMGYEYRIIAPTINRTIMLRNELLKAYKQTGINVIGAVRASLKFNFEMAKTKFLLEGIYKSVGLKFVPLLTKQMEIFRGRIVQNLPRILKFLENVIKFTFRAFEGITILGGRLWSMLGRVWQFFVDLDKATSGWSTKILALIAVWKVLNLEFLKSPLGMLITGFLALIALYDDFMVWKEGGDSLIDWGDKTMRVIGALIAVIASVPVVIQLANAAMLVWRTTMSILTPLFWAFNLAVKAARGVMLLFNLAMALNPAVAITVAIVAAAVAIGAAAYLIWKHWDKLKKWFGQFFDWIADKLKIVGNIAGAVKNFFTGDVSVDANGNRSIGPAGSPLGANGGGAQNVNQKTEINVTGSKDPQATATAVVNAQNNVNFNMARNLKGATR